MAPPARCWSACRTAEVRRGTACAAALTAALALGACSLLGPQMHGAGISAHAVELRDVPFFPADDDQSAAAALAMLLAAQQLPVSVDALTRRIAAQDRAQSGQSGQTALVATVGSYDLVPVVIRGPRPGLSLVREVQGGAPVLVLQNRGSAQTPAWRYAVAIGADPGENTITLRSGRDPRLIVPFGDFLASWRDGGDWGLVAARPEAIPVSADPQSWVAAAAPFEPSSRPQIAERAFVAATARWPDSALAWEALADARHALKDLRGSSEAWLAALRLAPEDHAARNNLAYVLLERRCPEQAEAQIRLALAGETDPQKAAIFRNTLAMITSYDGPSILCPGI